MEISLFSKTEKDKNLKFDQNNTFISKELNKVDEHEQWVDIVGYAVYRKKIRSNNSNKGEVYKGIGSQIIFNDKFSNKFYDRRSLIGLDYGNLKSSCCIFIMLTLIVISSR